MIDLVYKTILTIINKDNQGYLSPTEFNILSNNVQSEIFRNYFEDENRDKNRENRGLTNKGYSNLDFNQRQLIDQFAETVLITLNGSQFDLPVDLYFIEDDGVQLVDPVGEKATKTKVIEEAERSVIAYLNNSISKPTLTYPVYERFSNYIKVYPESIDAISMRYIRKPKKPEWTYTVLPNGTEAFDPSNSSFQDFELHESEFSNIVIRLCSYFGVNLRENEVTQIAENLKQQINIKDNN